MEVGHVKAIPRDLDFGHSYRERAFALESQFRVSFMLEDKQSHNSAPCSHEESARFLKALLPTMAFRCHLNADHLTSYE